VVGLAEENHNMSWSEHVFQYCERGHSVSFWGEPLNAISNAAFLVAGIVAASYFSQIRLRAGWRREYCGLLISLLFMIAIGSFLFHTFATRWSELADQMPITIFVFLYCFFALLFLLQLRWPLAVSVLICFGILSFVASNVTCPLPAQIESTDIGDS